VWPVWLLPMNNLKFANKKSALFSIFSGIIEKKKFKVCDICNIGIYGKPNMKKYNYANDNKYLEKILFENNGRKVLYSHSFYDKKIFYENIYNGEIYRALRNKYDKSNRLIEIYNKVVVSQNNKL
jgi:hypothetical protein